MSYLFTPAQIRKPANLAVVVETIAVPLDRWPGNCYGIASRLLAHHVVEGDLHYGHWYGPVAPASRFAGRPLSHHAWIYTPSDHIVDPTRWAFTDPAHPAIYVGWPSAEYDSGGQGILGMALENGPPAYNPQARPSPVTFPAGPVRDFVDMLLGNPPAQTLDMAFWLSSLPIRAYGYNARAIFEAFVEAGEEAMLPIDNRRLVLGGLPSNRRRRP